MAASGDDVLMYQIKIDAAATLLALDELAKKGLGVADAFKLVQQAAAETAKSTGASMEQVLGAFEQVASAVEGLEGGRGLLQAVLSGAGAETPEAAQAKVAGVTEDVKKLGNAGQTAYTQTGAAAKEATVAARGFFDITNMVRMALGTLEAMVIFQVVMAISNAFHEASISAAEYYQALINVTVAQKAMAAQGVATTNQELLALADELTKKMGIFAHVDMVDAVSQAALLTAQFKLSNEQIGQVVQMASVLAARTGKAPTELIDNILQAAKGSGRETAIALGITLDANAIKARALAMGLWDGKNAISEQAKEVAGLSLLWERLGPQVGDIQKNINTSTELSTQMKSAWKDLMETIGTMTSPAADLIKVALIDYMQMAIVVLKKWFDLWTSAWSVVMGFLSAGSALLSGYIKNLDSLILTFDRGYTTAQKFFDVLRQRQATGGVDLTQNAPVVPQGNETPAPPQLKQSDFDAIYKAYQSYYEGVIKATEDFNLRMQNMQDQYNLNVQKTIESYDLNVAQEKENFRLKQIQEEQRFQQQMRDLTAKYLMDLEDALRKRDAEAVIKIIEKYNMEKETAKQQEQLKHEQDTQAEKLKLEQMKQDEQLRLKQMADEFALQQEQARRSYQLQLTDLARALDNKLQEQAVKLGQEYNLNNDGIQKLYKLFKEYYGPDGKFASEQQASYMQMVAQSADFVNQMTAIMNQYYSTLSMLSFSGIGSGGSLPGGTTNTTGNVGGGGIGSGTRTGGGKGYAAGGIAMANSATSVTFGEGGPELAMFLPLNSGASAGGVDTYGVGGGGGGGVALIRIEVGSDLEARIVNSALTHAAIAIEKVNRSR